MSSVTAATSTSTTTVSVSVVVIGCGCPLRSMGWYHAEQLLAGRCPSARLVAIVEPFYMQSNDAVTTAAGYAEFHTWRHERETKDGINFYRSVKDLPPKEETEIRLGIISARTADNPSLFKECILSKNCNFKSLFLEKPGAPSVTDLIDMRNMALDAGIGVYMGFNKSVSSYVSRTQQLAATAEPGQKYDVTFVHNNAYSKEELPECFERNSEGMLKNMAIHELAILVTYYDVTVETIASVIADKVYSSCQKLRGPSSGMYYTDFDKVKFKITTKSGQEASIAADRCGGNDSVGIVTDMNTGTEIARYTMPDTETISKIPLLEQRYPGAMPYFFTQDPDYCVLKESVAKACIDGTRKPDGIATIDTAIATLTLAEHLTPILQEQIFSSS
jgi:predicted dehydrogenase